MYFFYCVLFSCYIVLCAFVTFIKEPAAAAANISSRYYVRYADQHTASFPVYMRVCLLRVLIRFLCCLDVCFRLNYIQLPVSGGDEETFPLLRCIKRISVTCDKTIVIIEKYNAKDRQTCYRVAYIVRRRKSAFKIKNSYGQFISERSSK